MKKDIKSVFEHQISEWLTSQRLRALLTRTKKKTLAETSFDHLIRWYPQVSSDGRDSYGLDIVGRLENSMISLNAKNLLTQICGEFKGSKKELKHILKKSVHFEHNAPVDVIKNKLIQLQQVDFNNIQTILNVGYYIVIITKEEENLLRKKGYAKKGECQERLNAIGAILINEETKSELIQTIKNRLDQLP
jgi:hypothetical protein